MRDGYTVAIAERRGNLFLLKFEEIESSAGVAESVSLLNEWHLILDQQRTDQVMEVAVANKAIGVVTEGAPRQWLQVEQKKEQRQMDGIGCGDSRVTRGQLDEQLDMTRRLVESVTDLHDMNQRMMAKLEEGHQLVMQKWQDVQVVPQIIAVQKQQIESLKQKKLNDRAKWSELVGYGKERKGYRYFDLDIDHGSTARNCSFVRQGGTVAELSGLDQGIRK